ncbi:DEAD/DEAH box helicase family protein [candidate division KSB1 bacterium]|nr:DEAD/DEAH box helicase family protein [candidate division KSB1 bacterium]
MNDKEAKARIKINKLLEEAGWRFFDEDGRKANIALETSVKLQVEQLQALGDDFQHVKRGFVDYLLLDELRRPIIVVEAKAERKHPLVGKEQARDYANAQQCRFVILSNGNVHYMWDLLQGNPQVITKFPSPTSIKIHSRYKPDAKKLVAEVVRQDYIALTQMPHYSIDPMWLDETTKNEFIHRNSLRFLRHYQVKAVQAIQRAVDNGNDRFLFEMATGTGKTLTAAAVIKLFLKTGNAVRILFLVDRLELETQALKAFSSYLAPDWKTVIYKENKDDWHYAEIVVTTVQSLLFNDKYQRLFSPTDFDLVISDEAHRSIGGNARAVFEYFVGYKLGLTATPKDYLKNVDPNKVNAHDPRDYERRLLLDTYETFGCKDREPTFRYSLLDGVREGYLINPYVLDARTEVTTKLLSEQGYAVMVKNEEGDDEEKIFTQRDFERKFFSEHTNTVFCRTILEKGLRDPISGEFGKTIVFTVSQSHAAKITNIFNEMAQHIWPGKYQSDFAVQVTSFIDNAQQFTINFSDKNNNLRGTANFIDWYRTCKARACVTVGMMTTGYDCTDILNIALMRPIFSPTDFIQIKGRGTRAHHFNEQIINQEKKNEKRDLAKKQFYLFDFFATCEYFEEKYDYDEILTLPKQTAVDAEGGRDGSGKLKKYENFSPDNLSRMHERQIGLNGMRIDREMFGQRFTESVRTHARIVELILQNEPYKAAQLAEKELYDRPEEFYNIEKLRHAYGVDWQISTAQLLYYLVHGQSIPSKDDVLETEFNKFMDVNKPDPKQVPGMKYFFKAYASDATVRKIIDSKNYVDLNVNPTFTMDDYKALAVTWRTKIPDYIKRYVDSDLFKNP